MEIMVVLILACVILMAIITYLDAYDARHRPVGGPVGYAVVEQSTPITSDPTADYWIDPGEPLPPAAPGADR